MVQALNIYPCTIRRSAFAYNTALIPVAAGVLYPFFGITFGPELAGLAMAMSSVTVVSLSLMLKRYVPPEKKRKERKNRNEMKSHAFDSVSIIC